MHCNVLEEWAAWSLRWNICVGIPSHVPRTLFGKRILCPFPKCIYFFWKHAVKVSHTNFLQAKEYLPLVKCLGAWNAVRWGDSDLRLCQPNFSHLRCVNKVNLELSRKDKAPQVIGLVKYAIKSRPRYSIATKCVTHLEMGGGEGWPTRCFILNLYKQPYKWCV